MGLHSSHHRPSRKTILCDEAFQNITETTTDLIIKAFLMPSQRRRVIEAIAVMREPQVATKKQDYRVFLHHVYRRCGPSAVLLCACQLGQHKVTTMRKAERSNLIGRIEWSATEEPFCSPVIHQLAMQHGLAGIAEYRDKFGAQQVTHTGGLTPIMTSCIPVSPTIAPNCHSGDGQNDEASFECLAKFQDCEYPSLNSVYDVLGGTLGASVRRMPVYNICPPSDHTYESSTWPSRYRDSQSSSSSQVSEIYQHRGQYRAAVSIAFSTNRGTASECLLSLDLQDWAVENLTRTLFGIDVQSLPDRERPADDIVAGSGSGTRLAARTPEIMLTGAKRRALQEVLGPEVDRALQSGFIHKVESLAKKDETDAVFMIVATSGAILNLALSREEGVKIWKRLNRPYLVLP